MSVVIDVATAELTIVYKIKSLSRFDFSHKIKIFLLSLENIVTIAWNVISDIIKITFIIVKQRKYKLLKSILFLCLFSIISVFWNEFLNAACFSILRTLKCMLVVF